MNLNLNRHLHTPLYEQLYTQIVNQILTGLLQEGETLPSLRTLSEELMISYLTVNKAYKRLEAQGYIEIRQGKGAQVRTKKEKQKAPVKKYEWQKNIHSNIMRSQYFTHRRSFFYDFSQAVVFPGLLPSFFLAEETKKMIDKNKAILTTYGSVQGDEELRLEITKYLKHFQQIQLDPKQCIITSGVQQGISMIAHAFLKEGDVVVVESPCYGAAIDVFLNKGLHIIPLPLDENGPRMDLLEDICQKQIPKLVYVNPTFQNPTGMVMSKERRIDLVELAEMYQFIIVEDDSFGEIYFDHQPLPPPIKHYDSNGHVIYLKGFSKTLAPGLRMGSLFADGHFFDLLYSAKACTDIGSPLMNQKVLLPLLQTKRMRDHLEKLKTALQLRRDRMIAHLMQDVRQSIKFQIPRGGFNLWLRLPDEVDTMELLHRANLESVSFLPGAFCFHSVPKEQHIRLSYSLVSERDMEVGLSILSTQINSMIRKRN
ncbi:PLP-dependent aminotransferase family protein [Caldalkalibacillus mannanilyticus]|uniref:MocR-like pyridoxine biosynthesis transcription factor PdxR n=1 Tax=Caldalkalibacillus mannanilyticus TaxID=1418 RepID=UPI000469844D|nr:PLP-dependent aminotransferase family protein [Caldalkalibacillus mannanilyticus]